MRYNRPENFLAYRIENLLLIVFSHELVDLRKLISNGLLQNPKRYCHSLQIFGTSGDMDVNGLESCIVYDDFLNQKGDTSMPGILK